MGELIAQQLEDLIHAGSGLGGDFEELHSRAYALDVSASRGHIEVGSLGHIHLRDDRYVGAVEDGWVLQWLVFAFGGGDHDEAEFFAEVVAGWADQVAHVLDEEKIQIFQMPSFERFFDHLGVKMADGSRRNLADVGRGALEAGSIVFGGQIANQRSDAEIAREAAEELFEERGLA